MLFNEVCALPLPHFSFFLFFYEVFFFLNYLILQVKLTVSIEDPRDVERRRLLGIDDENAPTRDDLAEALVQVTHTTTLSLLLLFFFFINGLIVLVWLCVAFTNFLSEKGHPMYFNSAALDSVRALSTLDLISNFKLSCSLH